MKKSLKANPKKNPQKSPKKNIICCLLTKLNHGLIDLSNSTQLTSIVEKKLPSISDSINSDVKNFVPTPKQTTSKFSPFCKIKDDKTVWE